MRSDPPHVHRSQAAAGILGGGRRGQRPCRQEGRRCSSRRGFRPPAATEPDPASAAHREDGRQLEVPQVPPQRGQEEEEQLSARKEESERKEEEAKESEEEQAFQEGAIKIKVCYAFV